MWNYCLGCVHVCYIKLTGCLWLKFGFLINIYHTKGNLPMSKYHLIDLSTTGHMFTMKTAITTSVYVGFTELHLCSVLMILIIFCVILVSTISLLLLVLCVFGYWVGLQRVFYFAVNSPIKEIYLHLAFCRWKLIWFLQNTIITDHIIFLCAG